MNTLATTSWLTQPRPQPRANLRLFCFPYAGSGTLGFRNWANSMPASIEVCPVQLPGRETRMREPAFKRVTPLVNSIAEAISPYLDKPFAFFGHSMGALIGFEMAREVRRKYGIIPVKLYVSGRVAPHVPLNRRRPLYDLPDPEFRQALRDLNGTRAAVLENEELMQLLIPLLRADFAVNEAYTCADERPLDCPILAIRGLHDSEVDREQLEAWREHTSSSFESRVFPGDHFYLNTAQHLLLQVLSQDLARLAIMIT